MPDPSDPPTAEHLVRQALDQYESALISYAAGILNGDLDRAREIVQDTLLKLYQADPAKVQHHLKAWLYRVCRNRSLDVLRKEQRMEFGHDILLDQITADNPDPGHSSDLHELANRAWELIEQLPPNQREVLKLKFQHDSSYQQIADITGLSVGNVGFILHHSLKKLRHQLQQPSLSP